MSYPLIRPVRLDDLPKLIEFAEQAAYGLTSLPRNPILLEQKILASEQSFIEPSRVNSLQTYLFCLEAEGRVIGTSAIISRIGMEQPFYAYHLLPQPLRSPYLKIARDTQLLHFLEAHKKPTEIGTLFLSPELRRKSYGKLLSLSRFLFMAAFKERFAPTIIAELRGVNYDGVSPFWDAIGKHFFHIDFPQADLLRIEHPNCIEELFPKNPIYYDLLPTSAQAVIGMPHPDTQGAFKILSHQGFKKSHYLDIFDAGPHLFAPIDTIHAIHQSHLTTLTDIRPLPPTTPHALISNNQLDYRATLAPLHLENGTATCDPLTTHLLHLDLGSTLRYYFLK